MSYVDVILSSRYSWLNIHPIACGRQEQNPKRSIDKKKKNVAATYVVGTFLSCIIKQSKLYKQKTSDTFDR